MRQRITLGVLTVILALTVACASSSGHRRQEPPVDLLIQNQVMNRVTIYLTKNRMILRRIGDCPPVTRCQLAISSSMTDVMDLDGTVELGWRWGAQRSTMGSWVNGIVTTTYWEGVSLVMTLTTTRIWLNPTLATPQT